MGWFQIRDVCIECDVTECMLFEHRSAGSSVRIGSTEVFLPQQLPQNPVLAVLCFSLLAKGRNTDGEPMHMDTDETAIVQSG